jgi:hypothetical protein
MPSVRKLSPEEVRTIENRGKGQRKIIEEQYDEFLLDYGAGDYGEADLTSDEKRLTVRNRLKAAAKRRGLAIDFKRTQGSLLRFKIGANDQVAPPAPKATSSGRPKKRA